MKIRLLLYLMASFVFMASCSKGGFEKVSHVVISTPYGDMKVLLYDDTPIHKENFLRLVSEGKYDSLLFHRVIRDFMIQGGDPNSLNAGRDVELGGGEYGSPIDAEISYPKHIHKRGALAAARKPDSVNPDKKSSGSQFYIVHGEPYTPSMLDEVEAKKNTKIKNEIFYRIKAHYEDSLLYYQQNGMAEDLMRLQLHVMQKVNEIAEEEGLFVFPDDVRETYMTIGGTPHLDGEYTVFGEVVEGFDVLDSIAEVAVDMRNRPSTDIKMSIKIID